MATQTVELGLLYFLFVTFDELLDNVLAPWMPFQPSDLVIQRHYVFIQLVGQLDLLLPALPQLLCHRRYVGLYFLCRGVGLPIVWFWFRFFLLSAKHWVVSPFQVLSVQLETLSGSLY